MKEVKDGQGNHLARQKRCPYLDEHKPSCGCDKEIHVEVGDPVVRFNNFNDSALDFALRVFVKDYGSQFKMKSEMRTIMYQEFKNYDIRIPWPIRTVYQGDEKREAEEIGKFDKMRNQVVKEYGSKDTAGFSRRRMIFSKLKNPINHIFLLSKISVISGKSSEDLARKLSRKIKANLVKSEVRVFADGESKITLGGKLSKRKTIVVQSIYPPVDTNLVQALSLISKAKETSSEVIAVIPYMGYARQDREFCQVKLLQ